jgi:hypothetical protein
MSRLVPSTASLAPSRSLVDADLQQKYRLQQQEYYHRQLHSTSIPSFGLTSISNGMNGNGNDYTAYLGPHTQLLSGRTTVSPSPLQRLTFKQEPDDKAKV